MTFIHRPLINGLMPDYTDDDQRMWLERLLEKHKLTATELARRTGLNPSTLTRFLQGSREGHTLSSRSVRKIEQQFAERPSAEKGFAEDEARPYLVDEFARSPLAAAISAIKAGRAGVDAWVIMSDELEGLRLYPDDVVLVDLNAEPRSGDVVCVQIYDWQNGKAKTVFRLNEPPYLVTGSLRTPMRRPEVADGRNVVIKGVVVARLSGRDMLYVKH